VTKNYKKAEKYYRKASRYKTEFGKLAQKRLKQLKEAGVLGKEVFYTVRIILYKTEEEGKDLIKKRGLKNCFVSRYKKYFGVFCGEYRDREEAVKLRDKLRKSGFKDAVVDTIIR